MTSFFQKIINSTIKSPTEDLFIVLADELIGIDFKQLLNQPQWNHRVKDQPNIAPINSKLNLLNHVKTKNEMVVGFTHMKMGSKVYLLGGERLKSGTKLDKSYVYNNPKCHAGFSRQVFELKKNNDSSIELKPHANMTQHYGKSSPMVANIGSKVYVICGTPYFQNNQIIMGSFEVYNLSEKYWAMLDDVPSYIKNSGQPTGQILGHLVLGDKLLIKDDTGKAYFFETKLHTKWKKLDEDALHSFLGAGLPLPTNGISVSFFPEFYDEFKLVISREDFEDAYAMIIYAPTCSLMYYQSLKEVFKGRYPVTKNGERVRFFGGRNFFLPRPNNQICAMWIGFDHYRRLRLFLTVFVLEYLGNLMMSTSSSSSSSDAPFKQRMSSKDINFIRTHIVHTSDCIVEDAKTPNYVFDAFLA